MTQVFLDVNVPMYAAGKEHEFKVSCQWVMEEIVEGGLNAVVDTEIIQEILYRYGAIRRRDIGVRLARRVMTIVPTILSITPEDAEKTIELFEVYSDKDISARDCIHAAVMINRGIEEIISTDEDFDVIKEIHRTDPRNIAPS